MEKFNDLVYAIKNKRKILLAVFNGEQSIFQPYGIIDNLVNGNLTVAGVIDRNGGFVAELVELGDIKEVKLLRDEFIVEGSWSDQYVLTNKYAVIIA